MECCQQLEVQYRLYDFYYYYYYCIFKVPILLHLTQKEAESKHDGLKAAVVMYRETAKFLDNCGAMCLSSKEQSRASLWWVEAYCACFLSFLLTLANYSYKCMAVALARAFALQKEKLKRTRDDLWSQLNKSTHSSSPLSGNSTSAGRASSMSPSPTYKSIPSPSSGVYALRAHLLPFLHFLTVAHFADVNRRKCAFATARFITKRVIFLGRGLSYDGSSNC